MTFPGADAPRVADFPTALDQLLDEVREQRLAAGRVLAWGTLKLAGHAQGIALHRRARRDASGGFDDRLYVSFSKQTRNRDDGHLVIDDGRRSTPGDYPMRDAPHPGGLAAVDDLLTVACEDGPRASWLEFLDLADPEVPRRVFVCSWDERARYKGLPRTPNTDATKASAVAVLRRRGVLWAFVVSERRYVRVIRWCGPEDPPRHVATFDGEDLGNHWPTGRDIEGLSAITDDSGRIWLMLLSTRRGKNERLDVLRLTAIPDRWMEDSAWPARSRYEEYPPVEDYLDRYTSTSLALPRRGRVLRSSARWGATVTPYGDALCLLVTGRGGVFENMRAAWWQIRNRVTSYLPFVGSDREDPITSVGLLRSSVLPWDRID